MIAPAMTFHSLLSASSACALSALFALSATGAPPNEEWLASIRKLYTTIEEGKPVSTRKIEFSQEGDPMEGTITSRQYKDGLSSIELSYVAGDHGGATQYFYYGPDGLFFVFEAASHWRFGPPTAEGEPTSIDTLIENRYYFRDGSCFHVLTRQAEAADATTLKEIVSKLPNKVSEPGKEARSLFKRALALKGIATGREAAAYFANEWEAP